MPRLSPSLHRLIPFASAAAFLGSLACAYLAIPRPEPTLQPSVPFLDFGPRYQGEKVFAQFKVKNLHAAPIKILYLQRHCDCVDPSISKNELARGEIAAVQATWELGSKRGDSELEIGVVYQVQGEDYSRTATVLLQASIIPDFEHRPDHLEFTSGVEDTQAITFSSREAGKVRLWDAYCDQRAFRAKLSADKSRVEVSFDPSRWLDRSGQATLELRTTSPNEPRRRIDLLVREKQVTAR